MAAHGYLGVWNYDQPDVTTMTNIAVVSCPAGTASCAGTPALELPQIGYIVFAAGPGGNSAHPPAATTLRVCRTADPPTLIRR